jgi:methyl-accepting chemotaxis protein
VVKYAADTTKQVLVRMSNERVRGMMESVAAGAEELNASGARDIRAMTKVAGDRDGSGRTGVDRR